MRRAKRSAFEIVLLRAKMQLLRLYLQLLLAVDAAVLAVGTQLKDLVALLFNAGDAAGILAPHDVHQTLGRLGLYVEGLRRSGISKRWHRSRAQPARFLYGISLPDRKSTRLNSSHSV